MSPLQRREFLSHGATLGLALTALPGNLPTSQSGLSPEETAVRVVTPQAQRAIDRGLDYLASRQQSDGSIGLRSQQGLAAVCALSGMAFLSSGSTPGRGPYGGNVQRCVDFILTHAQQSGFITVPDGHGHGPMYGHGFATLFLAEVYGMSLRSDVRQKLAKAVKLIIDTQNRAGGWRYEPRPYDADLSVTVCQIMALRAARNAGIHVPNETIDRCIKYVKACQNPDGGFSYMLQGGRQSEFPRSAAGVVALFSAGIYDAVEIENGLNYLMRFIPPSGTFSGYYFYGHYYAVQAMWQAGDNYWQQWYPAVRDELVSQQRQGGSWPRFSPPSAEYGVAMACIILQMPNNYLPIFQR